MPEFTGSTTIGNSAVFQTGASPTAKIGINTNAPGVALDVAGAGTIRGLFTLPATGAATAAAGKNSQPHDYVASVFNSGTAKAVSQTFQWQADPVNNNTTTGSGSLNLLYGSGTAIPAETGLKISSKGLFTFAAGQTFPGTGTVASVGLSAPATDFTVSGSPVTQTGTLSLAWNVAPTNLDTANAIVKRDATGSFNVTSITGTGTFATVTANPTAIQGSSSLSGGIGVHGSATAASGANAGLLGDSLSTTFLSSGVMGRDVNTSGSGGVTLGVQGQSQNPLGLGILGFNGSSGLSNEFLTHSGFQRIGVWGDAESGGVGTPGIGVIGTSDTGVAVFAENGPGGCCAALIAVGGNSGTAAGAKGLPGISATGGNCDPSSFFNGGDGVDAVGGDALGCSNGALGCSFGGNGVVAAGGASNGSDSAEANPGVGGIVTGGNSTGRNGACGADGIFAAPGTGSIGGPSGLAGIFGGDILVSGGISAGSKDFKIDHPLDPANKYLVHASVESSEMMNIYTGNVTTDVQGVATVGLPQWFEVLNTDFRYQLTVIGQFAQAIVAREIQNHEFSIRTSAPNVKVSWQVTGVRQDAFARAHPLVVELDKEARLKGFYIHPELYGQPEEKQIEWARHPQLMKQTNEARTRQLSAMQKTPSRPTLVPTSKVNSKLN